MVKGAEIAECHSTPEHIWGLSRFIWSTGLGILWSFTQIALTMTLMNEVEIRLK